MTRDQYWAAYNTKVNIFAQAKNPFRIKKVKLSATVDGKGTVRTFLPNGKERVELSATDNGGVVDFRNKTGETIATMYPDEYGNGEVGAWNRKGKGRTLEPGP